MSELETRQLRYFVAVAEELHFGRAARRLGMAQPPLSRAIRELERQLGVRLLERTTRQVMLTPAGEVLLRDARTALDAVSAAARHARHAGEHEPRLRLALKADIDGGLLPSILESYTTLPVELVLGRIGEQEQALRDGRADVALLLGPLDGRRLDHEPLVPEPFVVGLAATDPLAARTSLRLADLAGRSVPGGLPADQGVAHRPGGEFDLPRIFRLVELGEVVCFFPVSVARRYPRPEIAYRPVIDVEPGTVSVAWPSDSRSAAVATFVRVAVRVAAEQVTPRPLYAVAHDESAASVTR
jgi:DNA-binding transcriptional LysR family regulator